MVVQLHIALVTPEFGGRAGGIGTSLAALANGLLARGHRITVVTRRPVGTTPEWSRLRIIAIPCPPGHLARWAFRLVADLFTRAGRPDVVHAPEWGAAALWLASASDLPVVTRLDTPSFLVRELNGRPAATLAESWVERAERCQTRRSRMVLAASTAMARVVQDRWNVADPQVRLLRNPIDVAYLTSRAAQSWPVPATPGGIVYIGRLEARKGIDVLGPLLVTALDQTPCTVTVIGDVAAGGHDRAAAALRHALRRFGNRVTLLGRLPHSEAMTVVARADVVVAPSIWENAPLVVMEAMALGRTVVAASVGGIPELIEDQVSGYLVADREPDRWASVVIPLLADERRRRTVGREAAATARGWSTSAIAAQAEAAYEEAAR